MLNLLLNSKDVRSVLREKFLTALQDPFQKEYFEIYKNPTKSEFQRLLPVRGMLTSKGDLYFWNYRVLHYTALGYIDKEEGTDYQEKYNKTEFKDFIPLESSTEDKETIMSLYPIDIRTLDDWVGKAIKKNPPLKRNLLSLFDYALV